MARSMQSCTMKIKKLHVTCCEGLEGSNKQVEISQIHRRVAFQFGGSPQ